MKRTAAEAEATRRSLLSAALPVFAAQGYTGATLADIAKAAGVTRGAAYHHFGDKAELYMAAIAEQWATETSAIWAQLDGDAPPLERIRRFLVKFLTAVERNETLRSIFVVMLYRTEARAELERGLEIQRSTTRAWAAQLEQILREAVAAGDLREDVHIKGAAIAIIATANGSISAWLGCPDLFSPAADAEHIADTVLRGLTAS